MIPDSHTAEKAIEFIAGGLGSTLGIRAMTPIFRIACGFAWETVMDRLKERTYEFVKGKAALKIENNLHHLSLQAFGKELKIHHPNRDRTYKRFVLLSHYLHPERFSPLLQETVTAEMVELGVEIRKDFATIPRKHVPRELGVEVYA